MPLNGLRPHFGSHVNTPVQVFDPNAGGSGWSKAESSQERRMRLTSEYAGVKTQLSSPGAQLKTQSEKEDCTTASGVSTK